MVHVHQLHSEPLLVEFDAGSGVLKKTDAEDNTDCKSHEMQCSMLAMVHISEQIMSDPIS